MKLTIIDKYIVKELAFACLSVLFILLIIVLSTELVHLLSWVSQGIIPVSALMAYLINSLFEFAVVLIPLSLLMGILIAFGRLYRDSEMAAIMSAGIGPLQWYRPLMMVAVPTTLLLLVLMLFARPMINIQRAQIAAEIKSRAAVDTLLVGQFNRASKGGGVLFLESADKSSKQINNVFFQQRYEDESHVDLATSTNTYTDEEGRRYMMMQGGTHYVGDAGDMGFKIIKYKNYGIHIAKKQVAAHFSEKSKSIAELWYSTKPIDQSELQWRFALPLATIIVAFMALPLSRTDPRSGRYGKLALALILYLIYSNFLSVGKTWIVQQKVPLWVGTWWVHLIAIIFTFYLLKRSGYLIGLTFKNRNFKKTGLHSGS
ncbi:Lipopolysaccharide export system permease protein LptF [hydrothermal vent metagenome]|uniref:Lipopolysaccharide export system permease protein LptF n=1 Tax=hydrothermal vent metagenome TaxID=652676 RepID=A0A3B0WGG4_9ZZZZ